MSFMKVNSMTALSTEKAMKLLKMEIFIKDLIQETSSKAKANTSGKKDLFIKVILLMVSNTVKER